MRCMWRWRQGPAAARRTDQTRIWCGAPFQAVSPDGSVTYEEGKDLPEMKDAGLGFSPYMGGYQWHAGPQPVVPSAKGIFVWSGMFDPFHNAAYPANPTPSAARST